MQCISKPTRTELTRCATLAAVVSAAGGIAALWTVASFGSAIGRQMSYEAFVLIAVFGAFCAGLAVSPWLGRGGVKGAFMSLCSFLLATISGAWIAGFVGLNSDSYGMVAVWLMFQFFSPLILFWLALLGVTHWSGRVIRRKLT